MPKQNGLIVIFLLSHRRQAVESALALVHALSRAGFPVTGMPRCRIVQPRDNLTTLECRSRPPGAESLCRAGSVPGCPLLC